MLPPYKVANQEKIFIPVGNAITIVAAVKYARESISNPTTNLWCDHTMKPKIPILIIAYTLPMAPNTTFWLNLDNTWDTIPKPGMIST